MKIYLQAYLVSIQLDLLFSSYFVCQRHWFLLNRPKKQEIGGMVLEQFLRV